MYAFEIPNYIQGHRFSDDNLFYDSTKKQFIDQAGYGDRAALKITVGSPKFETVNNERALFLDNSFHGQFASPIPFQGSAVFVLKPKYTGGGANAANYISIFGDVVTPTSNGLLYLQYSGVQRRVVLQTGSSRLSITKSRTDDNAVVIAYALDQTTQKLYCTVDGITVQEAAPSAIRNDDGLNASMRSGLHGVRFGNLSGVAGGVAPVANLSTYMFEQHFYAGNILTENLAETKAFIDTLKEKYGIV